MVVHGKRLGEGWGDEAGL